MNPSEALKTYFDFNHFRPGQDEIVEALVSGRDVMGIMPTGGGKSLCYQLPAILSEGTAICVSPLIALMKDQVDSLERKGIRAAAINSQLSMGELNTVFREMRNGEYQLIYIAPERFKSARFMDELKSLKVSFFAIDEAHCLSQWGHDFRPDYMRLGKVIQGLGRPPIGAFTATATRHVRKDILEVLELRDPLIKVTGFHRPNLTFKVSSVNKKAEKWAKLSGLIEREKKGIIYCATRKRVEEVSDKLTEWDIPHASYHGGMSDDMRKKEQDLFIDKQVDIAVATNAFGMGIDRSDVRFVVHIEMPGSVEAYYQEAGRAGRDGLPAVCELYYNYADRGTQDFFIDGNNPGIPLVRQIYLFLRNNSDDENRLIISIQDLADALEIKNSMQVGTALKILVREGYIERFDVEGQRVRGTQILKPEITSGKLEFNEKEIKEKELRDRSKLDAMVQYASSVSCRQLWIQEYFGEETESVCEICDVCQLSETSRAKELNDSQQLVLRKLLSGVARMSFRNHSSAWEPKYGRGLIQQMLLGSGGKRMVDLRLTELSTFGILKTESPEMIRLLFDECLRRGLLYSTGGTRPLVSLTELGDSVMREKDQILLVWPEAEAEKARRIRTRGEALALSSEDLDEDLLTLLKKKRAMLARIRGNVPPYKIFSNQVLEDLATLKPSTVEEALKIKGIGPMKAKRVLPSFIKEIGSWEARSGKN